MIYDSIETAYTVLLANFATDLAALAAAKGVTIVTTCTFEKRQSVERALELRAVKPFCCINGRRSSTQGRDQGKRDSLSIVAFDYYAEGTDPVKLAKQVELAAEAIYLSADDMPGVDTVFGVGEEPLSWSVEFSDGYIEAASDSVTPNYFRRATVTVPVWDRDTGL